eukprot:SM000059S18637  [mRNA]  locus=s59:50961:53853:+ [translate_table: standard]
MTTAQESSLGFSKLTIPQGLQSYSMLFNGATALTLSCQSLADLYSGFSTSIGGGAITVPVARSDSSGTTFVFTSYLNLCTAGGARQWPSTKVGESGIAWGSSALVAQSGSGGVASYIFSHPGSIGYLGTPTYPAGTPTATIKAFLNFHVLHRQPEPPPRQGPQQPHHPEHQRGGHHLVDYIVNRTLVYEATMAKAR